MLQNQSPSVAKKISYLGAHAEFKTSMRETTVAW